MQLILRYSMEICLELFHLKMYIITRKLTTQCCKVCRYVCVIFITTLNCCSQTLKRQKRYVYQTLQAMMKCWNMLLGTWLHNEQKKCIFYNTVTFSLHRSQSPQLDELNLRPSICQQKINYELLMISILKLLVCLTIMFWLQRLLVLKGAW